MSKSGAVGPPLPCPRTHSHQSLCHHSRPPGSEALLTLPLPLGCPSCVSPWSTALHTPQRLLQGPTEAGHTQATTSPPPFQQSPQPTNLWQILRQLYVWALGAGVMATSTSPVREPKYTEDKNPPPASHILWGSPRTHLRIRPGPAGQDCQGTEPPCPPPPGTGHTGQASQWSPSEARSPRTHPFLR